MEKEPIIRGPTLKALAVIPLSPNSYTFQVISQASVDTGTSRFLLQELFQSS